MGISICIASALSPFFVMAVRRALVFAKTFVETGRN